jgi:DNA-binding transcriptional LysR family regulator
MARTSVDDLIGFLHVARQRSFTRAAAQLGVSPSALSHSMRGLETRLGLRLLTRTTRSVATTEAGERLLQAIGPRFDEIESEVAALSELRDKPAGNIRITADEHAVRSVLWPRLRGLLRDYSDIKLEIVSDNGLTDIVAERFDAGVRLGGIIAKDMVAIPVGPPMRMAAVAAPAYFSSRSRPKRPEELIGHSCINMRLPTRGGLYAWEFEKNGREKRVRVDGQLVFNSIAPIVEAAVDGYGIAYLLHDIVRPLLNDGRLVQVLADWSPPFQGYNLYFPSRRQPPPAFALVIEALRYRAPRRNRGLRS